MYDVSYIRNTEITNLANFDDPSNLNSRNLVEKRSKRTWLIVTYRIIESNDIKDFKNILFNNG